MLSEWSATTRKSSGRDSLTALPARGGDLLSLGEPVRVGRAETAAERAGIHRHRRVQMRVAEEGPVGNERPA